MFDMSLWGPHGLRTLGKAVFKSHVLNAPWEWSKKEQPGLEKLVPCKTFKVAMVSSRRVRPRAVGGVHGAHQVPQAVWRDVLGGDLLGLGKVKVERLHRSLEEDLKHDFTTASPWVVAKPPDDYPPYFFCWLDTHHRFV